MPDSLTKKEDEENPNLRRLLILISTGIVVTLMDIAFLFVASILSDGGQIDFGGIVIIGPIPILTGAVQKLHG